MTVYIFAAPTIVAHIAMFFRAVLFAGSVYGGWRIFKMSIFAPDAAGDAASLAESTANRGFVFFAISLATLVIVPGYFYAEHFIEIRIYSNSSSSLPNKKEGVPIKATPFFLLN